jgi:hypothetical protein
MVTSPERPKIAGEILQMGEAAQQHRAAVITPPRRQRKPGQADPDERKRQNILARRLAHSAGITPRFPQQPGASQEQVAQPVFAIEQHQ